MPRGKKKPKPSEIKAETLWSGWLCGICGQKALADEGYTQLDPRYSLGSCPKHLGIGLVRDPKYLHLQEAG